MTVIINVYVLRNFQLNMLIPFLLPDKPIDPSDRSDLSSIVNEISNNGPRQQSNEAKLTQSLLASGEKVLLQTAIVSIVSIQGEDGEVVKARLLLDSASQRTFMTNQLAQRLYETQRIFVCFNI